MNADRPIHQAALRSAPAVALVGLLGLSGCMGLLNQGGGGSGDMFSHKEKEKPAAERFAVAQETAISGAHGGTPGTPIAWSDAVSGLQGSLVPAPGDIDQNGCRKFQQIVILTGETLEGSVVACTLGDDVWKLAGGPPRS